MTCKELHEQITAFVDNRVDEKGYREKIRRHIAECGDCRASYERELLTRMVVRERTQRAETPDAVRRAIAGGIDRIADEKTVSRVARLPRRSWLEAFAEDFLSPVGIGIAALLVVAGFLTIINNPVLVENDTVVTESAVSTESPSASSLPENYFNKAADNFTAILRGQLALQFESDDPAAVRQFFADNGVAYNVVFPVTSARLGGGVVSEHNGTRYAHLLYSSDSNTLLYLFEVPESSLSDGKIVYVTRDVLQRLHEGERIWEEPLAGQPLVMYETGDLVIAAVSNSSRLAMEKMIAFD